MTPVATRLPASIDRSGTWQARPGLGVYVHIPFCRHRCNYCDFNTYTKQDALFAPYIDALVAEIDRWEMPADLVRCGVSSDIGPATSVFFGGGTPTLLAPGELGRVLAAVDRRVGIAAGAEITVEANPETVDEASFAALLEVGFNRVSIGVQSLAPRVLERLGRTHSGDGALAAVAAARRAGVQDLNVDLIYGSPWESEGDWVATLTRAVAAGPDHVSAYALTVEEGTPLATLVASGRAPTVDPDVQADRHATAEAILGAAGFERYEVSNWARPGRASCHNVLYWSAGDYLGFGAGAHAHIAGRRWWTVRRPADLIAAVASGGATEAGSETLEGDERASEALALGLRLASGIDLAGFEARFGRGFLETKAGIVCKLQERGFLERAGGTLRLAGTATLVGDDVICRLL